MHSQRIKFKKKIVFYKKYLFNFRHFKAEKRTLINFLPNLDPPTHCIPLPLSEQRALRARKILIFSLPSFSFYNIFPPLPPPVPSSPSSRPYYLTSHPLISSHLLPCPLHHLRDEVESIKRIMPNKGRRRRTEDR